MARKKRTAYTPAQRKQILAAAISEKLTAAQVQKKFGVTPVTYYSWRKKYGAAKKRGGKRGPGRPPGSTNRPRSVGSGGISDQVRSVVQSRVQAMVQRIVRAEVASYLNRVFGTGNRGTRPRKRK